MQLSKHFSFNELTHTGHTELLDENRESAEVYKKNLTYTAHALEEIREIINVPMRITSGYRMPKLNKAIGGSKTSKHTLGLCADFQPIGMTVFEAFEMITANKNKLYSVRKAIIEGVQGKNWVHIQAKILANEPTQFFSTNDGKNFTEVV